MTKARPPLNGGAVTQLCERYVYQIGTEMAWDIERMEPVRISALRLQYSPAAVEAWLRSPSRRDVARVVFEPARQCGVDELNLYRGLAVTPARGECRPILELLQHLVTDSAATDEGRAVVMAWVLRWLALPLQQPGAKMRSALVFHGPEGAGKNLLFDLIVRFYGVHGGVVGQDQLESQFNGWASAKLFLVGDEVITRSELRHQKGKLKALITSTAININEKMQPLRSEANHCNLVFLSNEVQPLALDDGDRRYFVVHTPPPREREFYRRVAKCIDHGGDAAFLAYLLALDLGDFDEFSPPPETEAKRDLIDLGRSPPERFVREWLDGMVPLPVRPCSVEQLFRAYVRWCGRTGVRWGGEQAVFTRHAARAAGERLQRVTFQVPQDSSGRRSVRGWLPRGTGAPDGANVGKWFGECVDQFADDLAGYLGAAGGGD